MVLARRGRGPEHVHHPPPNLPLEGGGFKASLSRENRCDICMPMTSLRHAYFFWYYGIPKPLAEEGARSI